MKCMLKVREGKGLELVEAVGGERVMDALARLAGSRVEAPCGGKGLCGKCRVRLLSGSLSAPDARESHLLTAAELGAGIRLACLAKVAGEAELELPERGQASIVSAGPDALLTLDPPLRLVAVSPREGSLENQSDDESRLLEALALALPAGLAPRRVSLRALPGLARCLRDGAAIEAVVAGDEVLSVAVHRPTARSLGLGVDLGTTTVVAFLVDLSTGERLGSRAELN
jgi:uncharacterized 2Fe-2S/4Fe-4S cluster protein (DUF4445 family)